MRETSDRRSTPPAWRRVVIALVMLLLALAVVLPAYSNGASTLRKRPAQPATASSSDSVVEYGPVRFTHTSSNTSLWIVSTDAFTADTTLGRRYVLEVVNGPTSGTRVTGMTFTCVDLGRQFVGTSDFGSSTSSLLRTMDVLPGQSNNIEVAVVGPLNSYVTVRIVKVWDPTFRVFGRKTYVRPSVIAAQADTFTMPLDAGYPYTLWALNGDTNTTAHRLTNATVNVNGTQVMSSSDFGTGRATASKQVNIDTDLQNIISLYNQSAAGTKVTLWATAMGTLKPALSVTSPAHDTLVTRAGSVWVAGSVTDHLYGIEQTSGVAPHAVPGSFGDSLHFNADGIYPETIYAINSARLDTTAHRTIIRDSHAPELYLIAPASGSEVSESQLSLRIGWDDLTPTSIAVDDSVVAVAKHDTIDVPYALDLGPNRLRVRAVDAAGNVAQRIWLIYRTPTETQTPLDAGVVADRAGTLSATEGTDFRSQVQFLFTGSQALQDLGSPNAIHPGLEAVIRGKVVARDFGPIPNVRVQVLGHDSLGYTRTRSDGRFDLVVNGGATYTLRFRKDGFLEAQRQVAVPVQDYAVMDSVALIGGSGRKYFVNTSAPQPIVSRFESDSSGDRRLTMLFQPGTVCSLTVGSQNQTLTQFHVVLKEFTVGGDGPITMPGELPPTSAYTYCVDFGVDEANALVGSTDLVPSVRFDRPVVTYVKNFLGIPVGSAVPSGGYDAAAGQWVPREDGVVLKYVQTGPDGLAQLDTNGDGGADSLTQYAPLGIDSTERARVAQLFAPNDELWRTRVSHFSSEDMNLNKAALDAARRDKTGFWAWLRSFLERYHSTCGCEIENENRVLGQQLPVAGTPYWLDYRSDRQVGDQAVRTLSIPLTGDTLQRDLIGVHVVVDVAGRRYRHDVGQADLNRRLEWLFNLWDGKDLYGRVVNGSVTARIRLGYEFIDRYALTTGGGPPQWDSPSAVHSGAGAGKSGERNVTRIIWGDEKASLGAPSLAGVGLDNWTISSHHIYDSNGDGTLYLGDGKVRMGERVLPVTHVFAGRGLACDVPPLDGDAATSGCVAPNGLATGPDGSIYLADAASHVVARVARDGRYHILAGESGNQSSVPPLDGSLATENALAQPSAIAVASDGTVFFADEQFAMVFAVTTDGRLHHVAGGGPDSLRADVPATSIPLGNGPHFVTVGPNGSVYVSSNGGYRVLRVDRLGIVHFFAGAGGSGLDFADGKADSLDLPGCSALACDAYGNVFIGFNQQYAQSCIFRVAPDGRRSLYVAPTFFGPAALAFGPDGALYCANYIGNPNNGYSDVFRVEGDGTLTVVAGGLSTAAPAALVEQENYLARATAFPYPMSLAIGADGAMYVGQAALAAGCMYQIAPPRPTTVAGMIEYPSEDGHEVYVLTPTGRHMRTYDPVTGVTTAQFGYTNGVLTTIADAVGRVTTITRSGNTTTITAPFGQVTTLAADGMGNLASLANPNAETHAMHYLPGGLMDSLRTPRGFASHYVYGTDGRLVSDGLAVAVSEPDGGTHRLDYAGGANNRTVKRTTAEGRQSTYSFTQELDGRRRSSVLGPDGAADSTRTWFLGTEPYGEVDSYFGAAGDSTQVRPARDSRFGWLAPVDASVTTLLPVSHRPMKTTQARNWHGATYQEVLTLDDNLTYTATYDTTVRVLTTKTPLQRTGQVTLDAAGRPVWIASGTLLPVTLTYDVGVAGHLRHVEQGNRSWDYTYDTRGRLETAVDALGIGSIYHHDLADRDSVTELPGGRIVSYRHDPSGNLVGLTPPGSGEHAFGYTVADVNESYTPPAVPGIADPATRYEFDHDRLLTHVRRPDGMDVTLDYGATTGQLLSLTQPRGVAQFGYDARNGQLTSTTSPDTVNEVFTYDGPILTSETWSGAVAGSASWTLGAAYRPATETVSAGGVSSTVTFGYDGDGLLTSVDSTGAPWSYAITRDVNGLPTGTALAEGAGNVTSQAGYNGYGELESLTYWIGTAPLFQQSIEHNQVGQVTATEESWYGGPMTRRVYGYDLAGRLDSVAVAGVVVRRYEYDSLRAGNGNRTAERDGNGNLVAAGIYDAQDRMTSYGNATYAYTAGGDLASRIMGGDTTGYAYDAIGSLVDVRLPGGDSLRYVMDGQGRRVGVKRNGAWQRRWLYGGAIPPLAELDGTGALVNRYVYATLGHAPDLMLHGDTAYRVVTDHLGSVRAVVRASDGAIVQRTDYDAWGFVTADVGGEFQSLAYAGGLLDRATGLVRFGARDYEAGVGRWIVKDPLRTELGLSSAYLYAGGTPINLVDPAGLQPADAGVGWLARWKCADAKAKQFYGKWLAISDATSYLSLASLASSIVQAGVQSGVDAITFDAIWNARLKGLRPGLSWGARGRLAEEGASEAARLAGLRASMTWVGNASGVASAFATGFSVGARIAFINDCGCEKAGQGK